MELIGVCEEAPTACQEPCQALGAVGGGESVGSKDLAQVVRQFQYLSLSRKRRPKHVFRA